MAGSGWLEIRATSSRRCVTRGALLLSRVTRRLANLGGDETCARCVNYVRARFPTSRRSRVEGPMRGGDPADNGQGLPNAGLPAFCSLLGWGRKQKGRAGDGPQKGLINGHAALSSLGMQPTGSSLFLFLSFFCLLLFCIGRRKSYRQLGSEFIQITPRGRTDENRWCILKKSRSVT